MTLLTRAYLMEDAAANVCKVGISHHPPARLDQLNEARVYALQITAVSEPLDRPAAMRLERELHMRLRKFRLHGEYFRLDRDHRRYVKIALAEARATISEEEVMFFRDIHAPTGKIIGYARIATALLLPQCREFFDRAGCHSAYIDRLGHWNGWRRFRLDFREGDKAVFFGRTASPHWRACTT